MHNCHLQAHCLCQIEKILKFLHAGSSKPLFHRQTVPDNHQSLSPNDDVCITSLAGTIGSLALIALANIQ